MDHDREQTEGGEEYEWVKNEYLHNSMRLLLVAFFVASLLLYTLFYFVMNSSLTEIAALFIMSMVILLPILYMTSKEPRYIAISEDGIHFRYKKGNEKHIKWEEIREIYFVNEIRYGARGIIDKGGKKTNLGFVDYNLAKEIQTRHKEKTMLNSK